MAEQTSYFTRLWAALMGRDFPFNYVQTFSSNLTGDTARLLADLEDRDKRIAVMKQEYALLEHARDRATAISGHEQMEQLFKTLSGPLSNLAALSDLSQTGQTVAAKDLLTLVRSLFLNLEKIGVQPLGRVGEIVGFDLAFHQCMSGVQVQHGSPVLVELPGFRMRETILLKAMISSREP